jgi:predicted O-methyltransferase YrrM
MTIRISYLALLISLVSLLSAFGTPPAADAQAVKDPEAAALARLQWMRRVQGNMWNVNADEGKFLRDLVVKVHARHALEIGTSNGYSGIWTAMGLRLTGGHLTTLEIDEGRAKLAQENFQQSGVAPLVHLIRGDALKEIPHLQGPFEFVFIDAWKQDYVNYLKMVLPLVPSGGVIVAHNVTDLHDELVDYLHEVQTNPQLSTTIENPGPGGFAVSYKK